MKYTIYVDGQEGTTGLKIHERLAGREDLEILSIAPGKRKDPDERRKLLNQADIAFLCLPDDAAREAVAMIDNPGTRVIDASTAHRTAPDWAYGIPELRPNQADLIRASKRVAVPGCYASAFNLMMTPLVEAEIVPWDYPVTCHAVSGYSGGGRKLIEQYERDRDFAEKFRSPSFYATALGHKHLPEMQAVSGLRYPPVFTPILGNYYQGMTVAVPLLPRLLQKPMGPAEFHGFLAEYYNGYTFVKVMPLDVVLEEGKLDAEGCNGTNRLEIYVFGHKDQILLTARLDNLGKGASGAAVQNMNLMIGADETSGLM